VLCTDLLPERVWSNSEHEGVDISGLATPDGQVTPLERVRTFERALNRIVAHSTFHLRELRSERLGLLVCSLACLSLLVDLEQRAAIRGIRTRIGDVD